MALKPDYSAPFRHLGDALAAKGQLNDAIASYRKAIELKPGYAKAHYRLAIALQRKGEREAAKREFSEAERLDPELKPPEQ